MHFAQKYDYLHAYLPQQQNQVYSSTARNKEVGGGRHNVPVHYVEVTAPNQKKVLCCNHSE